MAAKRFSKQKWLEKANAQIAQGFLSERDLDGKTYEEITANRNEFSDDYFVIS